MEEFYVTCFLLQKDIISIITIINTISAFAPLRPPLTSIILVHVDIQVKIVQLFAGSFYSVPRFRNSPAQADDQPIVALDRRVW